MSTSTFATVRTAKTSVEADRMISRLRSAGLHPVDLSMSANFSVAETEVSFPIQVSAEEAESAKAILDLCDRSTDAS